MLQKQFSVSVPLTPLGSNAIPIFVAAETLLNAQIPGILATTQKLTYDFVVHSTLDCKVTKVRETIQFEHSVTLCSDKDRDYVRA